MGNLITKINNYFYPPLEAVDLLLEQYKYKMAVDRIMYPEPRRNGNRFFTTFYPKSSF